MTPSPFGGCKPSHYGTGEIAVTTSSGEARHHRIPRFSLAVRQGSFHDTDPYWEFGGTGGRTLVPLALAAAVVAVVALGASHFARSPSRSLRVTSSLLACVAFGALIVGFVAIGTGH